MVAADFQLVAQLESGSDICHRLVVAARDLPPGNQLRRPAGRSRLARRDAHHHGAHILVASADLHGQIGHIGSLLHAGHGTDAAPLVIGDAGRFGIGAEGVLLHHPQICATVVQQNLAVIDHSAVDARHGQGDTDQQAEADAGEDELSPGMQDVASGQADHSAAPASRSTT